MQELGYWLAFDRVPHIGRARFEKLEAYFGTLEAAWRAGEAELKAAGLDARSVQAIGRLRPAINPDQELDRLDKLGIKGLTWYDADYPSRLKETYDRPPVLYLKGELLAADQWSVAVVGTRRATSYGRQTTEYLVEGLVASGLTVVSGLAKGIDTLAHQAALRSGGRTIAVLPCPVNEVYPASNRALAERLQTQGALLSDYPPGTHMSKDSFWRRNRVIAGMTLGTVVVEAPEGSGALITARLALEENREVFAVPGGIFSPMSRGTNGLIRAAGAKLVTCVDDILNELEMARAPRQLEFAQALPEDETERSILQLLTGDPQHVDEIIRRTGYAVATVSSALAMLELKGMARQPAPMSYVRS